jgi:SpoVK/Ycf46/Vps4 family AAA+-type ATPase
VQTFFGEIKPEFVTVVTGPGPNDRLQVPKGQMSLPGVADPVYIDIHPTGAYIQGTVKRKDRARLIEIANLARQYIQTQSVYRSKAIRLGVNDEGELNITQQPEFLDLTKVKVTDMIHTAETQAQIETNMFSPLLHTDACRRNRIPLKRGILLSGKYGTGKSLTARVTAKVANDNGWTFIILDRSKGLGAAIEFARTYQPCVIFAEDIDRAADRNDEEVNDLVNLIDGVISKDMEIMVVLTTNFIENIDKALLRPGRFDAVITIQSPDNPTAQRLIRAYGRDLIEEDVDLNTVGELVDGQIPAMIREVVERAKLSMLMEDRASLSEKDLIVSATGMKRHMELLEPPAEIATPAQRFYDSFRDLITKASAGAVVDADGNELVTSDEFTQVADRLMDEVRTARVHAVEGYKAAKAAGGAASLAGDKVDRLAEKISAKK